MNETPTASELEALALRCEQASGPDRELDAKIFNATDPKGREVRDLCVWKGRECLGAIGDFNIAYTASLDAAMRLVPEGWVFEIGGPGEGSWACVFPFGVAERDPIVAASPALALTAASLRARATIQRSQG